MIFIGFMLAQNNVPIQCVGSCFYCTISDDEGFIWYAMRMFAFVHFNLK